VHSAIGREKKQGETVKGLGLRKLNQERELLDTPAIRGMVNKIPHLVKIVEENIVAKKKSVKATETKAKVTKDEA
jgi:large subunit ribosomal protein L30